MSVLKYSTSIGMGCGFIDACKHRLGLDEPVQFLGAKVVNTVANGILAYGVAKVPIWMQESLKSFESEFPLLKYTYPTLDNRMFYSVCFNGSGAIGFTIASGYHFIRGDYDKSANDLKKACKFGWRAGVDYLLLYTIPSEAVPILTYLESCVNAIGSQWLRDKVNSFTSYIDDKIIGKTYEPISDAFPIKRGVLYSSDFINKVGGLFRRVMRGKTSRYVPVDVEGIKIDETGLYYKIPGKKSQYALVLPAPSR